MPHLKGGGAASVVKKIKSDKSGIVMNIINNNMRIFLQIQTFFRFLFLFHINFLFFFCSICFPFSPPPPQNETEAVPMAPRGASSYTTPNINKKAVRREGYAFSVYMYICI